MALDNPDWSTAGGTGGTATSLTLVNNNDALNVACGGAAFVTFAFIPLVLTAGGRLNFEGTDDGANWVGLPWLGVAGTTRAWQVGAFAGPAGIAGLLAQVACAGLRQVRCRLGPAGGGENVPVVGMATLASGSALPVGQQV